MLDPVFEAMASDPESTQAAFTFTFNWAVRHSDERVLAMLARNPSLPENLAAELDKMKSAKVLVARLTRPGVPVSKIMEAARDKRVTVATAVASAVGLPDEAYDAVVKRRNTKVWTALVSNSSAPDSARKTAAVGLMVMNPNHWGGSYGSRGQLRDRLSSLLGEFPELVDQVSTRVLDGQVLAACVSSPAITPKKLSEVLLTAVDRYEKRGHNYRSYWDPDESAAFVAAALFTDMPADIEKRIIKALSAQSGGNYSARRSLDMFRNNRSNQRTRPEYVPLSEESPDAVSEQAFKAMLAQALTLKERVRLASSYDLTDRQFTRALLDGATGWQYSQESCDTEVFRSHVLALCKSSADSPIRLAALLARFPLERLDASCYTDAVLPEVVAAMCSLKEHSGWFTSLRHNWVSLVVARGLSEEIASVVPASVALREPLHMHRPSDFDRFTPAWRSMVGNYLVAQLGTDDAAWTALDRLGEDFPGSLSLAAVSVKEALS